MWFQFSWKNGEMFMIFNKYFQFCYLFLLIFCYIMYHYCPLCEQEVSYQDRHRILKLTELKSVLYAVFQNFKATIER